MGWMQQLRQRQTPGCPSFELCDYDGCWRGGESTGFFEVRGTSRISTYLIDIARRCCALATADFAAMGRPCRV
jgi:hypothetical protein